MLVLSRKFGERIVIGNNIVITVMPGAGGRVKLGITAPDGVPIHREELLRQKSSARPAAMRESPLLLESA